jgi:hypothetical protein
VSALKGFYTNIDFHVRPTAVASTTSNNEKRTDAIFVVSDLRHDTNITVRVNRPLTSTSKPTETLAFWTAPCLKAYLPTRNMIFMSRRVAPCCRYDSIPHS